jgi:hypothetical protein
VEEVKGSTLDIALGKSPKQAVLLVDGVIDTLRVLS